MDFRCRRHDKGTKWTDSDIVELLQLWSDKSVQIELKSSLRNQRVFDRIAHTLEEKGIYRSGDQCRDKIKKMKVEYRRIKDNDRTMSWRFYDVMDRVLGNQHAISYSSLEGAVSNQQVFQSPLDHGAHHRGISGSFGPTSLGGFLFGLQPKMEPSSDIKCEEEEESLSKVSAQTLMMRHVSEDEQDSDWRSQQGQVEPLDEGENSTNAGLSASGVSDENFSSSATQPSGNPVPREQPKQQASPFTTVRQRKRRRGGKTSCSSGGARCCGQASLDQVFTKFLDWQKSAEERLLSLEEVRLEREFQAEQHREEREDRRAEREREHELRLFGMLTGAWFSAGRAAPSTVRTQTDSAIPAQPQVSTPLVQSVVSTSQVLSDAVMSQATSNQEMATTSPHMSEKAKCKISHEVLTSVRGCSVYLSNRGNQIRQQKGILQEGFVQYAVDRYHERDNPEGIINLGTSENKLCYDLLQKRLTQPDMLYIDPYLLQYSDWRGHTFTRKAVADFLTYYCSSPKPLNADNVVLMNGCGSLFSCVSAVICDPSDVILIPTPFYGVIVEDVKLYSDVNLYHVPLDCEVNGKDSRPFHLTVEKLEMGLKKASEEGLTVRAVILMNPHNPLAEIYTPKEMTAFLEFAKRHELHVIVDEVYMLSIFDESVTFHSVLSLDSLPDPQRTHVMWGLSKDLAMAGFRIGTLYTGNRELVEALAQLGSFHGISGTTQHQVAQLLQDKEWLNKKFLPENRVRLKAAHSYLTGELQSLGIPYLHRPAALYVWTDLRKYLREPSFEEELSLWRSFLSHKVVLSCGQAFHCSTPGWFRIVFADDQNRVHLGLTRLKKALTKIEEKCVSPDSHLIKEAAEENRTSVKEDGVDSDNAVTVNSTSSPQGRSSDQLKDSPDSDAGLPDCEELQDCQASKQTESLESLIGTLRQQIRSSDWLEKKTPELSPEEDPEVLDVFQALLQRARK